ncbi:MAG: hypothetical protein U0892_18990 [Pirellulales bacterium]
MRHWNQLSQAERDLLKSHRLTMIDACRQALLGSDLDEQRNILVVIRELELAGLTQELLRHIVGKPTPLKPDATVVLTELCNLWGQRARNDQDTPSVRLPMIDCRFRAVEEILHHGNHDILDAWLMLVTWEDKQQRSLMNDPLHNAFRPMLDRMGKSSHPAVMQLLAGYLRRSSTPRSVLSVIAERPEREFAIELSHTFTPQASASILARLQEQPPLECFESFRNSPPVAKDPGQIEIWTMIAANTEDAGLVLSAAVKFAESASFEGRRGAADLLKNCRKPSMVKQVEHWLLVHGNPDADDLLGHALHRILKWINSPSSLLKEASREFFDEYNLRNLLDFMRNQPHAIAEGFAHILYRVHPEVLDELVKELGSPAPRRRAAAIEALHLFEELPQIEKELVNLIYDPQLPVRLSVIDLLMRLNSRVLFRFIPKLLEEPTTDIQDAAARALEHFQELGISAPLPSVFTGFNSGAGVADVAHAVGEF